MFPFYTRWKYQKTKGWIIIVHDRVWTYFISCDIKILYYCLNIMLSFISFNKFVIFS